MMDFFSVRFVTTSVDVQNPGLQICPRITSSRLLNRIASLGFRLFTKDGDENRGLFRHACLSNKGEPGQCEEVGEKQGRCPKVKTRCVRFPSRGLVIDTRKTHFYTVSDWGKCGESRVGLAGSFDWNVAPGFFLH
jgi:hypothetical protein